MRVLIALVLVLPALAGCASEEPSEEVELPELPVQLGPILNATLQTTGSLVESVVDVAVAYGDELYEPTIDVSNTGTIYVTGHTLLVDTTGAPAYFSRDDGQTWQQLPFAGSTTMPDGLPGATPPPSDEIFIVTGDDGWAFGVDITLATYPVNMWSGDGSAHAYHNPDAYDEAAAHTQSCSRGSLNDRPWAAYANGTLLMVNNPGGGPVQVGVMAVPPALPAGGPSAASGATWNLCASPGGWIPGIPDMREDGAFAVPQMEFQNDRMIAVTGNAADVFDVQVSEVFELTNSYSVTVNFGQLAFDAQGTLFGAAINNTDGDNLSEIEGRFKVALSTDAGLNFTERTFVASGPVQSLYIDGNMAGPGALAVWAVPGDGQRRSDWYVGHLQIGPDGGPVLENVFLAIDEGPYPSTHVTGSAAGPDGRAYISSFAGFSITPSTPLSVWVQEEGPTLPVQALDAAIEG